MSLAAWNVYEGDLDEPRATGTYSQIPGSNVLPIRACGVFNPWVDDVIPPPGGSAKFRALPGLDACRRRST